MVVAVVMMVVVVLIVGQCSQCWLGEGEQVGDIVTVVGVDEGWMVGWLGGWVVIMVMVMVMAVVMDGGQLVGVYAGCLLLGVILEEPS